MASRPLKVIKYEVKDGKRTIFDPAKITVPYNTKIDDVVAKILRRLNLPLDTFVFQNQNGTHVHTHLAVSSLSSDVCIFARKYLYRFFFIFLFFSSKFTLNLL